MTLGMWGRGMVRKSEEKDWYQCINESERYLMTIQSKKVQFQWLPDAVMWAISSLFCLACEVLRSITANDILMSATQLWLFCHMILDRDKKTTSAYNHKELFVVTACHMWFWPRLLMGDASFSCGGWWPSTTASPDWQLMGSRAGGRTEKNFRIKATDKCGGCIEAVDIPIIMYSWLVLWPVCFEWREFPWETWQPWPCFL